MNSSSDTRIRLFAAVVVALGFVVVPLTAAQATSETVMGSTPIYLSQVQNYSTGRYHGPSPATVSITPSHVAPCGGATTLWLRNLNGVRITNQPAILTGVQKYWTSTSTGTTTIPAITFRMSSQTTGSGCAVADQYFSGSLVY